MATLHLAPELLADMSRRCEEAYPKEACGLLLGRLVPREGKGPKLVAERLHPARNAETSRASERYALAPDDFVAADNAARDAGLEIVGVYHSHPDAPARPSEHDRDGAQPGWFFAIVSVEGDGSPGSGRAGSWSGFSLRDGAPVEERICAKC